MLIEKYKEYYNKYFDNNRPLKRLKYQLECEQKDIKLITYKNDNMAIKKGRTNLRKKKISR